MIDALHIGWTQAEVVRHRRTYRILLGVVLAVHVVVGLAALLFPLLLAKPTIVPSHVVTDWIRLGGLLLFALTLFYMPGWIEPLRYRGQNLTGVAVLGALGLLLLCLGWIAVGLIELVAAALLGVTYNRLAKAELMSLPGSA